MISKINCSAYSRFVLTASLVFIAVLLFSSQVLALMSFNPLSAEKIVPDKAVGEKPIADNFPVCNPAPSVKEISGGFEYHSSLLSTSEALKLQYAGIINGGGDGNQMLLVQDYVRGTECLATDKKTKLLYGQTIRTILKLSDWNMKLGASLPAIAADATLNKKNHQFHIYAIGLEHKDMPGIVADISNKDFDVTNYSTFREVEGKLIRLINDNKTTQTVKRLGVVPQNNEDQYKNAIVTSLAIQNIKNGNSCDDAKSQLKKNPELTYIIDSTYRHIVGLCDASEPSAAQQKDAGDLLLGFRIK